jgi:hypothetical protein
MRDLPEHKRMFLLSICTASQTNLELTVSIPESNITLNIDHINISDKGFSALRT